VSKGKQGERSWRGDVVGDCEETHTKKRHSVIPSDADDRCQQVSDKNTHEYGLHKFMRFIRDESDGTTKTAQAISFTTPPASLIFRLKKGVIGDQSPSQGKRAQRLALTQPLLKRIGP